MSYWVYILKCLDGTLYTGITNNLSRRLKQHKEGTASRYTRARGAVRMIYIEKVSDKGEALRREIEIKKMSRSQKLLLGN